MQGLSHVDEMGGYPPPTISKSIASSLWVNPRRAIIKFVTNLKTPWSFACMWLSVGVVICFNKPPPAKNPESAAVGLCP